MGRRPPPARGGDRRAAEAYQEEYAALTSGLRELIFADPRAYVRFLKPIHGIEVLRALLFPVPRHTHRDLEDVPAPLVEGLAEFLLAGSEIQREAILDGVWTATRVPDAFVPAYDLLLGSASAEVRRLTLMALMNGGGLRERHVAPIREIVKAGRTRDLTVTALQVLAGLDDPEATRYVLHQFHTAVRPDILDGLAEFLPAVLARTRGEVDAHVDGLRRAFTLVASRPPETPATCYGSDGYIFRRLVYITLDQLPADRAREVLADAREVAPTPRLREGARKLLEAIDGGEARRDALVALYLRHLDIAAP